MRNALTICLLFMGLCAQTQEYQLAKPLIKIKDGEFFEKSTSIHCELRLKGADLHYTLNGEEPTRSSPRYRSPIKVKWEDQIKVKAFKEGFKPSETVTHRFFRLSQSIASVALSPPPKAPYAGKAGKTLSDQIAGSFNFRDGKWIGYNQGPVTIDVDLGNSRHKTLVTLSTLISPGSWIMNPDKITISHSRDGVTWESSRALKIEPVREGDSAKKAYYQFFVGRYFRYVRLTITPMESLPDWHPGKGQAGWLFIDEILVQ